MYGKTKILVAFLFLLFISSRHVLATEPCGDDKRGTISVTGIASEYYPPDVVTIILGIETMSKTASEAVTQNSLKAEKVVGTLKTLVDISHGDSIKTTAYSVKPTYEYDNVKKKSILTGYRVLNQVTVRTKKMQSIGSLLDKAIENGANTVQGITFSLDEEKAHCEGVLRKATQKAHREATLVAESLGVKITGIKQALPSCGRETPYPLSREVVMEAKAAEAPETTIEAGDIAVKGTITIVFYIEKGL